ncbi:MAG: tetratricopeptide repeat protein [Desulfovibrionaceae bacterium]|nr:tetratricopeptide repeat protein [Desulfovibrionaceae bacterium]MBF0512529.1 tetratricopeptide repeat protein [Desulfovibrionaceae bacterium]
MKRATTRSSAGLSKNLVIFGLAAALVIGFAAGWLVRDAREPADSDRTMAGPRDEAMAGQIEKLKALAAADPRDASAWARLGHLYFDTGQPGPAVAAYGKYLELKPGDPDVLTDMGVMYRELGQPDRALECFEAAIKANPGHEIARFNKGIVLLTDKSDKTGALAAFDGLLRINPNAKAPDGRPVEELIDQLRPRTESKPGMLIGK